MKKVRYIMIGGFLGAGKTTALLSLASHLAGRGVRAGLITNDQSTGLVDTGRARAAGQPVEEVTGGCFCCKFDHLAQAAQNLECNGVDVLIAEPVGSCADVRATVGYPLRQLFGDQYVLAPLSVVVDPFRCAEALGAAGGFSEKVVYIYRKQLEEADAIIVNKIDLLTPRERERLGAALRRNFPGTRVLEVSCKTGEGLAEWFELLMTGELSAGPAMEVDYDLYADGEALLGWLNARASFTADPALDGNGLMMELLLRLKRMLGERGIEIAHGKVSVESDRPSGFGSVSLTSSGAEPSVAWTSEGPLGKGLLTLNLRAEADPDVLRNEAMTALFTLPGAVVRIEEIAAFRPGRPTPTHRFAAD